MAGETFEEVVVDVAIAGEAAARWTHRIRSLAPAVIVRLRDLRHAETVHDTVRHEDVEITREGGTATGLTADRRN